MLDACQVAFVALWLPPPPPERLELATEAMELARATGSERGFVVSATPARGGALRARAGRGEMVAAAEVARREAERLRIAFGEMVLDGLELPWLAMAGRFDECDALVERIRAVAGRIAHTQRRRDAWPAR